MYFLRWVSLMDSGAQQGPWALVRTWPFINAFKWFVERVWGAEGKHTKNLILELTGLSQTELSSMVRKTSYGPKTSSMSGLNI